MQLSADQDSRAALRSTWIGILAMASLNDIKAAWPDHEAEASFEWLRKPNTGLVLVQGKAGGTGSPFHLGEVTVTRCALRVGDGTVGHGYVQGRDKQHAELAARLDALLQTDAYRDHLLKAVIWPLRAIQEEQRAIRSRKAASTKVEFFTMARGGNPA